MSAETFVADDWLHTVLGAHPTLSGRVYADVAPPEATLPVVVWQQQSSRDTMTHNGTRIWAGLLYAVRVVGEGESYLPLRPLADAVDAALQQASGTAAGGQVLGCVREQVLRRAYVDDGQPYREIVQLYRLQAQGA